MEQDLESRNEDENTSGIEREYELGDKKNTSEQTGKSGRDHKKDEETEKKKGSPS